jgi:hypothetical protein
VAVANICCSTVLLQQLPLRSSSSSRSSRNSCSRFSPSWLRLLRQLPDRLFRQLSLHSQLPLSRCCRRRLQPSYSLTRQPLLLQSVSSRPFFSS